MKRPRQLLGTWMIGVACLLGSVPVVGGEPPGGRRPLVVEVDGQWMGHGVSFSPYRRGQAPGGAIPTHAQLREDLTIVRRHWPLIRLYDAGPLAERTLEVIREDNLPLRVILGVWIGREDSEAAVAANRAQVAAAIRLARAFADRVIALNVGNETLVHWSGHRVTPALLTGYLQQVRAAVAQPVATADDYQFWLDPDAEQIAAETDFIMLHAYALWNGRQLTEAMGWTGEQYDRVAARFPQHPVVLAETGWATRHDPAKAAPGQEGVLMRAPVSVAAQAEYLRQHYEWVERRRVVTTLFEAFDEPWKGSGPDRHPDEAEKHWGVFQEDRRPKESFLNLLQQRYPEQATFYSEPGPGHQPVSGALPD